MYEPTSPGLIRVKSLIAATSWQKRVDQAREAEKQIRLILAERAGGLSLNQAIAKVLPASRRTWAMQHIGAYRAAGLEALIDTRTPREPKLARACRGALEVARTANPSLTVEAALAILRAKELPLPSRRTIQREFRRVDAGLRREQPHPPREQVIPLAFAGGELLAAAEAETGAIAGLTREVVRLGERAVVASAGKTPAKDVALRDGHGRFTARYNRARRRRKGEAIASYLGSAAEKAEGRVPSWPRFVHERAETLAPKLAMLTFGWLVAGSKGWDSLRAPDAAGLEPLTGFAYMPATLAKFVSALAISGAGTLLLEEVGRHWHKEAQARWGEEGAMAAIFIDNQAKEVWTSLFTMSGKVSHRNRIMPCVTTTYAHTGAGTPLVLSVQSGSAPLAPRVLKLVQNAEALCGGDVRRATVIDAEGSTFDVLAEFKKAKRIIVTPLRPARAPELDLRFSPGSYYRPFRDGDELRIATCTLTRRSTNESLELGALLVRREHRKSDTVLLTTGIELGMEGRSLAELYYTRWPVQENAFKEGGVLGFQEHRGNCGRMVANVAVVTTLERLEERKRQERTELGTIQAAAETVQSEAAARTKDDQRAQAALATRRRRLDALVAAGKTDGKRFARVAIEHQQALVRAEDAARATKAAALAADKNRERREKLAASLAKITAEIERLEPQRVIRQLDVEQDKILTATKLTAAQLISFAKREYLPSMPITAETFVSRVFPIQGRKEIRGAEARVVFYENPRDTEVNAALRAACSRLNARGIKRDGLAMTYAVETPEQVTRSDRRQTPDRSG